MWERASALARPGRAHSALLDFLGRLSPRGYSFRHGIDTHGGGISTNALLLGGRCEFMAAHAAEDLTEAYEVRYLLAGRKG